MTEALGTPGLAGGDASRGDLVVDDIEGSGAGAREEVGGRGEGDATDLGRVAEVRLCRRSTAIDDDEKSNWSDVKK